MGDIFGVDIHAQYQAGISIATLKSEGYSFVVTKASEGTHIPPLSGSSTAFKARYLSWLAQARQLGMTPGLYHWIKSGNAAGQAAFFHGLVVEAGGPGGMLIQLDCEDDASYQDLLDWRDEWNRLSAGHPFLLYTGGWWWRPRGWDGLAITPHLWDSHYLTADADTIPDDPVAFAARIPETWWRPGYGGWPSATMLQFTSRGDAGGLGNDVDLNVCGLSSLAALTGKGWLMALTDEEQADLYRRVKNLDSAMYYGDVQGAGQIPGSEFRLGFGPGEPQEAPVPYALMRKLDEVLAALKTGGMDPEAVRAIVREELDKTKLAG